MATNQITPQNPPPGAAKDSALPGCTPIAPQGEAPPPVGAGFKPAQKNSEPLAPAAPQPSMEDNLSDLREIRRELKDLNLPQLVETLKILSDTIDSEQQATDRQTSSRRDLLSAQQKTALPETLPQSAAPQDVRIIAEQLWEIYRNPATTETDIFSSLESLLTNATPPTRRHTVATTEQALTEIITPLLNNPTLSPPEQNLLSGLITLRTTLIRYAGSEGRAYQLISEIFNKWQRHQLTETASVSTDFLKHTKTHLNQELKTSLYERELLIEQMNRSLQEDFLTSPEEFRKVAGEVIAELRSEEGSG